MSEVIIELDTANQVLRVFDVQQLTNLNERRFWKWDGSGSYYAVKNSEVANVKNTQACEIPLQSLELFYKQLRQYFKHNPPVESENPGKYDKISFLEGQITALHEVIEGFINGK